jgi:hypothetical protein
VGVDRASLTSDLVTAARQGYPELISFHFESRLLRIDFTGRRLVMA